MSALWVETCLCWLMCDWGWCTSSATQDVWKLCPVSFWTRYKGLIACNLAVAWADREGTCMRLDCPISGHVSALLYTR